MNVHVAKQPPSLSNIGRQSDALKTTTLKHVHKPKIVLQPWDGLELVDNILAEGRGSNRSQSTNGRDSMVMSSPRVNPVLNDKVVAESSRMQTTLFLKATASNIQNLPAMLALKESEHHSSEDDEKDFKESRKGKGKRKHKKLAPSPCFLVPPRRGMAEEARAPAVGKYFPRYGYVERRSATPVLPPKVRSVNQDDANSVHEEGSVGWDSTAMRASTAILDRSASFASPGGQRASTPAAGPGTAPSLDQSEPAPYWKHSIRDCSSSFKSKGNAQNTWQTMTLSTGPSQWTVRSTRAVARYAVTHERAYTPFGEPCGAKVDYPVHNPRPGSSIDIGRVAPRHKVVTRMMFPTEDTSQLAYNGNVSVLSTKPRLGGHYDMKSQSKRPDPPRPSDATELDPYHDSMLTSPKRGFVDIRRMMTHASEYAAEEPPGPSTPLNPNYNSVLSNAPRVAFPKSERMSPTKAPLGSAPSYNPDDSSVRRHRPACFMPRTERDTFSVKGSRVTDEPYNVETHDHVASTSFVKQISREIRDKRFEHS